jgi:hypothetical protein
MNVGTRLGERRVEGAAKRVKVHGQRRRRLVVERIACWAPAACPRSSSRGLCVGPVLSLAPRSAACGRLPHGTSRAAGASRMRGRGASAPRPLAGLAACSHQARRNKASTSGIASACGVRVLARWTKQSAKWRRSIMLQSHAFKSTVRIPPSRRATSASNSCALPGVLALPSSGRASRDRNAALSRDRFHARGRH